MLEAGQTLTLPDADERAIYVADGSIKAKDTTLMAYSMAVITNETGVQIEALEASRIAIIGGEAMDKRFIDWNFVSSRRDRISQAREDWQAGRFPKVPGDEDEFVPLPS